MPTALEALEQAAATETEKPAGAADAQTTTEADKDKPAAPATPTFEEAQAQVAELEKNASAGEVEKLREQNRGLILGQFPEEMRPGVKRVLDLASEASYVQSERTKLDEEKKGMSRDRVLAEFKEAGVTADHLKFCPDEATMKTMAESIKALGGKPAEGKGDEADKTTDNPPAMKEPPAATTTGGAPQTGSNEKYHRMGVEKGLSAMLGEFVYGQE